MKNKDGDGLEILTEQELDAYSEFLHAILLRADEANIPKGTMAEKIGHAIDKLDGLFDDGRLANGIPKLKKLYGEFYNEVWHAQTFERIGDLLSSGSQSVFHIFLNEKAAQRFYDAAPYIRLELKKFGIDLKRQ